MTDYSFSYCRWIGCNRYVRDHSVKFKIERNKIGIIDFSAGAAVTAGSVINYSNSTNRPDFAVLLYVSMGALKNTIVPVDAPPLFIAAATDDSLGLASSSVKFYSEWLASGKSAELHMYSKGGHGFGMRKQNLPVDSWIENYSEWLHLNQFL